MGGVHQEVGRADGHPDSDGFLPVNSLADFEDEVEAYDRPVTRRGGEDQFSCQARVTASLRTDS